MLSENTVLFPLSIMLFYIELIFFCYSLLLHLTDGAASKKKAEQQAAKVALQQLSGFLNVSVPDTIENYKGFLKERLEALGLDSPEYKTEQIKSPEEAEGPRASSDNSHCEFDFICMSWRCHIIKQGFCPRNFQTSIKHAFLSFPCTCPEYYCPDTLVASMKIGRMYPTFFTAASLLECSYSVRSRHGWSWFLFNYELLREPLMVVRTLFVDP